MNKHGKFRGLLVLGLLLSARLAMADTAAFWQQQDYQPVFYDFNQDQIPDLLLQAKSDRLPSLLVLGEFSRNEVMFLQKNSRQLPVKISGMNWSASDAQLLPLRTQAKGPAGLLVIFSKRQQAMMFQAKDRQLDFSNPITKFDASQWPFLTKVSDFDLQAGDFDNDGIDEILQLGKLSGEHEILKIQSNSRLLSKQKNKRKVAWGVQGKSRIIVRDFNKDGAADIFALAKQPGSPHYLLLSGKSTELFDVEAETVPATLGGMPWFDDSSGTMVVKLLHEQRPALLRFYNHEEKTSSADGSCLGWLYDPVEKNSQEYCPDPSGLQQGAAQSFVAEQGPEKSTMSLKASAPPRLEDCPIVESAVYQQGHNRQPFNSWCPPPVPKTPQSPPQFSSSSYAVNQTFSMQLPNTWDLSALTYDVWAVRSGVFVNFAGAIAPGGNFSLPAVTASGRLEVAGSYEVMYRSCNGDGCSGFSPSAALTIFSPPTEYLVTTQAGTGGSISPTSRSVPHGSTTSFTVTPQSGFTANQPTGCGTGSWANNIYTTPAITSACNVNATFTAVPVNHQVTASAGTGGSISPTSRSVPHGSTTSFTVTAHSGFTANQPTGCGTGSWVNNIYTTPAITGACNVNATFTALPVNHQVTASAGTGGSISPTSRSVPHGSTTSFTVTAHSGFTANQPSGCGTGSWVNNIYTTPAITGACNVNATFTAVPVNHQVTASAGTGGSISPTSRSVPHGSTTSFTVTPQSGFTANRPTGCGTGSWVNNTYTTPAITSACSVNATFTALPVNHQVTASAGTGGSISPTSRSVPHGSTTSFTVTPQSGFTANRPTGCGTGSWVNNTYTTPAITSACSVNATFTAVPVNHQVTASAGTGGSISPTSRSVPHGSTTSFTVTPQSGFTANRPTGCGNGSWANNTYTTPAITAPCAVSATFTSATPTLQAIFLHTDVLGSVIAETDANGVLIKKTEYKPFGQSIDN